MIKNFKDKSTERIYRGIYAKEIPHDIQRRAFNKLRVLNSIVEVAELIDPPSNRLEALQGRRKDQFSIRINDQWRICFRWVSGDAYDVQITDYH